MELCWDIGSIMYYIDLHEIAQSLKVIFSIEALRDTAALFLGPENDMFDRQIMTSD